VTSGPGWHWDSRGWIEIDGNGADFEGYSTTANVDVTASNVTIRNDEISEDGGEFGISLRHTANVTIDHTTITSPEQTGSGRLLVGIKDIYGDSTNLIVSNDDISHASTGVQLESGLVESDYIHDMGYTSGDHVNGITSNGGGSTRLTIEHNTVLVDYDQTDAISLFQDFGKQTDRLITDNLVAGGGYAIYGGANTGKAATATGIVITDNRFSDIYYPESGYYGPITAYAASSAGNEFSGNVWDATGAAVSAN